jgi:hypothetical protein
VGQGLLIIEVSLSHSLSHKKVFFFFSQVYNDAINYFYIVRYLVEPRGSAVHHSAQIPGPRSPWRLNFVRWRLTSVVPQSELN